MLDTNTINTASNVLVQAGYTINSLPASVPQAYTGLATSIVTAGLSILAVIAAVGRAVQAWKTQGSAVRALVYGTNVPKNLQAQVIANTLVTKAVPLVAVSPVPAPAPLALAPAKLDLTK